MRNVRRTLVLALVTLVFALTARPCGPDFPTAVFVLKSGPGGNYASYAAGHLGVPQGSYRTRHLVIAYNYLSGHPLPAGVQKQAVAVNDWFQGSSQVESPSQPPSGLAAWLAARTPFGLIDGFKPDAQLVTIRPLPGEDIYNEIDNCLQDAFTTAARTLADRISAHTEKDPAVVDWIRGQDAVFTNCGNGKPQPYYGPPEQAPKPPPAPHPPAAAPANAPQWLQQDRAYQLAAASFYALNLDDALARFRVIAMDKSSPWRLTARYLIARTYIRKASIGDPALKPDSRPNPNHADTSDQPGHKPAADPYRVNMSLASQELIAMRTDPSTATMRSSVDRLLDYVEIRYHPDAQAEVLATRLQSPNAATYEQALIDLSWLHSGHDDVSPVPEPVSSAHPNDMLSWIDAVSNNDERSALKHWQSSHSTAWLVAALSSARPDDPSNADLLKAARAVSTSDPGWLAVTYYRLRLSPHNEATRSEILALLPQIKSSGDVSTINLFLSLSNATAPTLNEWLANVPRIPAGESSYAGGEDVIPGPVLTSTDDSVRGTQTEPIEDSCGRKLAPGTILPLFDADAAGVFNREMPLRLLASAAESPMLPENLRFQVAQAAWTRAVLLDKPEIAHRMTPLLTACRAAWKPVLSAYDAATTPDSRQAAALLALMRFASTVPSVWEGEDRRAGFAAYDEFRENWWCTTVPKAGNTVDSSPDANSQETPSPKKVDGRQPPLFLTPGDLAEAHTEVVALEGIPRASTYFAQQALAWQKLHPQDPQTPDILGEADRVIRNSCRKDPPYDEHGKIEPNPTDMTLTSNLAKTIFETLHRNYPNSVWAKRYTSWE